jgi:hypothetical protein
MDISGNGDRTPSSWRRPATACLTTLGLVAAALVAVGVATAIEQRVNPPTCFGIGFGCTPDAVSTVYLVGFFFAAPVVAAAWLLTAVGWAVTRRRSDQANRTATWWPAWLLAVGLAVVVVLALVTAG